MINGKFVATLMVLLVALMSFGVIAQDYKADAAESTIRWEGKKVTGGHYGMISLKTGTLNVKDDNMSGEFAIDMGTISVTDGTPEGMAKKLRGHLASDDFFSVANHPTSVFKITAIKSHSGDDATHHVTGELTIKGITNSIEFPAKIDVSGDKFTVKADVKIDRTKWDIKFRSGSFFENLGDKLIYDDIVLTLNISGSKA